MKIELTQFVRPNGLKRIVWFDNLPDELEPKVKAIHAAGLRFTCEDTGLGVSLCIENDKEDLAIEIANNGSGENSPSKALERMIRKFKVSK